MLGVHTSFDKGEGALDSDVGSQRRLAAAARAVKQHRQCPQTVELAHVVGIDHALLDDALDVDRVVEDAVGQGLLELLVRDTKGSLDFRQGVLKIAHVDLHLRDVVADAGHGVDLDVAVESKRRGTFDETRQLGTAEILGACGQPVDVDIAVQDVVLQHLGRVNLENLNTTLLVGQRDLDLDLKTTRTQQGIVDHVLAVGHADQQDVVQLVDTIELTEKLVDDTVADTGSASGARATLFAYGVQLVKDDDVQLRLVALLLVLLLGVGLVLLV